MNSMAPKPPASRPLSTGNDIVALSATDKERTILPRFFSRILDAGEQMLYDQPALRALPFDNYVWLLWSVKESVYKYKQRTNPGLVFSPTKIPIRKLTPPSGQPLPPSAQLPSPSGEAFYKATIVYGSDRLYSRSIVRDDMISTVVSNDENFKNTSWECKQIDHSGYAHQSSAVRKLAVDQLSATLSGDHLQIGKNTAGYPVVLDGEEQLDIPISLAHHDRWVAWSFVLPAGLRAAPGPAE